MRLFHKLFFTLTAVILVASCTKYDFDNKVNGEAVDKSAFRLITPSDSVSLNAATPAQTVVMKWTAATPGIGSAIRYKWVATLKSVNDFDPSKRYLEFESDNNSSAPQVTLTYKQLDDALKAKGVANGGRVELLWTAEARNSANGSALALPGNTFVVRRMADGATPFVLLGPVTSLQAVAIDPGSTTSAFTFNWTRSLPAPGGAAIKYKVLFAERKLDPQGNELPVNWNAPLFTVNSNSSGIDSFARVSYKDINDSLNKYGITNLSNATQLKWTVVATSGTWSQRSDYVNDLSILREVRMFLPGGYQAATGNGNDWDPGTAPELIRDQRPGMINNMFYIYLYLPANAAFKVTQGRSWDVNYGGTSGNMIKDGDNFTVSTAGVYRISFNRSTMKYDIRLGRMGFVGGATGAGWNPPNVFPNYAMGAPANNLFVGLTNFTADAWKLIDNDQWNDGSGSVAETRSYGSNGPAGSTMEVNGPNFPNITAAGRYRVIWDGRNVDNIKYDISPASEMRLVGDGINQAGVNDWDPASSPQMTYAGNGVWTITIALKANKDIKFLAGNAWGAFDYEDNSGGSQAVGTARKIKWDGNANFKTPATAGTYTITLNENTQTVTIN